VGDSMEYAFANDIPPSECDFRIVILHGISKYFAKLVLCSTIASIKSLSRSPPFHVPLTEKLEKEISSTKVKQTWAPQASSLEWSYRPKTPAVLPV
jgi:hypothetical protein